jgi:hypothetical protein
MVIAVTDLASRLQPFKSRYMPLARLSKWMEIPTLPTVARENIGLQLSDSPKPSNDKTNQLNRNLPFPSV